MIKLFRVWNPDELQLMYFSLDNIWFNDRYLQQHAHEVEQCTGMYDKDGKDIYENDILLRENAQLTYKVEYSVDFAAFVAKDQDGDYLFLDDIAENSKVIGDIRTKL